MTIDPALVHEGGMFVLGVTAAIVGSLAGLGGGFIAAPMLRLVFHETPDGAASLSLVMVTANVASASAAFLRQGRVNVRLGVTLGLLAIPGSVAGAILVRYAPGAWFDFLYAALLIFFAINVARESEKHAEGGRARLPWGHERVSRDRMTGIDSRYVVSTPITIAAGVVTGFLSSFFGIGGGIIVVPLLLRLFVLPAHIVSATSHFVILFSAPFGVATHALHGGVDWHLALPLSFGALIGGQIGAHLSRRIGGVAMTRLIATLLGLAASSLVLENVLDLRRR